ncbi:MULTISPECIES: hypothetical protein [Stenotrophomonas]|uniref:Transmembrane protein n=1 Tax=Stenotrophomonas maltophilia TaxID=40324 RepID=A0AA40Y468_STEMA|nr:MULTISPECIES: hypothetical protein [Stenotrophomonas]KOQ70951.1 hypothetical protein ABW43_03185 [Stenotrophomonas maltophilia]MBH1788776.1 hypothetical protein [Stenotrophomonas maltophilia]
MDDRSSRSAGAKIVAFPAGARADRAEAQSGHIDAMQEVLVAIDTAIKEAEWSPDHQDQLAICDEQAFRRRFGFTVNRLQREQIITLKHEADLTDKEIKILRSSGSLVFQNGKLSVMAPTLIAIWGYIQMVMLFLMMVLSVLAAVSAQKSSWPGIAGIVALNMMLMFGMNLSNDVFIWPQRIRKRVQQQRT